jgi:hypothetical protein
MKKQQYQHAPKLDWTEESISGPVTTKEQKQVRATILRLIESIKRKVMK